MKNKKILTAVVTSAVILGTVPCISAFAEGEENTTVAVTADEQIQNDVVSDEQAKMLKDFISKYDEFYSKFTGHSMSEEYSAELVQRFADGLTFSDWLVEVADSEESKSVEMTNQEIVEYLSFSQDESEKEKLVKYLESGVTKKYLVQLISDNLKLGNLESLLNELTSCGIESGEYVSDEPADKKPQVTVFVARLYRSCLGREYDKTGLNNWVTRINNLGYSASDVLFSFYNSREYISKNVSESDYVINLYNTVLGRTPAESEIAGKLSILKNGVTRNYLLNNFAQSKEFAGICEQAGISVGSIPLTDSRDWNVYMTAFIARLYNTVLNRNFDSNGIHNWINRMTNQGYSATDVAYCFINSKEFINKNLSNADYVKTLYKSILNRNPSESEVLRWTGSLDEGYSRNYVLHGFVRSREFTNLCQRYQVTQGDMVLGIRDSYPQFSKIVVTAYRGLERIPDDNEVNNVVRKIVYSGYTASELMHNIFSSAEYRNRCTTDETYVYNIYNAVLGRNPYENELNAYLSSLSNGWTRYALLDDLMSTDEFKNICGNVKLAMFPDPYPLATARLNQIGWDLSAAFYNAASISYYGHTVDMPQDAWTGMQWYANYGFTYGRGNCYVMAAMFCEMAKTLGYDAHQISGYVPLASGGYGDHSWVEINFSNGTYVFDPDFTNETGYNGYMITYGQSGTWKYVRNIVMS